MIATRVQLGIVIFAFLSVNISPVRGIDYFPLLFMIFPLVFGFSKKMIIYFSLSGVLFLFFLRNPDLQSVVQLFVFLCLAFSLGIIAKYPDIMHRSAIVLLIIHIIWFLVWIFIPTISNDLLQSRGPGKNSFFYSEPSYASISLMSIYLIYILFRRREALEYRLLFLYSGFFLILLISTKSLTGVMFAGFILLYLFAVTRFLNKVLILCALLLIGFVFVWFDFGVLRRVYFISDVESFTDLIATANAVEPSGAWRLNLNIISYFFAIENPLGNSRFNLEIDQIVLPSSFSFIMGNELFNVFTLIKGQSLFSSFVIAFGVFGFLFITIIFVIANFGYFRMKKRGLINASDIFIVNCFVLYGVFFSQLLHLRRY